METSMPVGTLEELENIIAERNLYPVFQPIYEFITPAIVGYEALIRGPADSGLHSPIALFETAKRHDLLSALEYICRDIACEHFARSLLPGKLFLNISPMSFVDQHHENGVTSQIIRKHGIAADRIVIELSEQYPMDDYSLIRLATTHYRRMGFEIAIDDLGAGYAGLRIWSEIAPDHVKIDRHFIENINDDSIKREFVRSIHDIARGLGCNVIAEGIETSAELEVLRSIGIHYGQGYLLGRPVQMPSQNIPASLVDQIRNQPASNLSHHIETVEAMTDMTMSIPPDTTLEATAELMRKHPELQSIPVVNANGEPTGIIIRNRVVELFLGRFGRELYAKKPVADFMETPIVFDCQTSIQDVSRTLTADSRLDISMDLIVTRNGLYLGTGKLRTLLQRITELQLRSARYANPLTLLPGNVPIYEWIDGLLSKESEFHIAYFDINYFKPYNDRYGYGRGDEVILKLGEILQQQVNPKRDFVGHIGGDDFVIIFTSLDWELRCKAVQDEFMRQTSSFYNAEDRVAGGIYSDDRRGNRQFFPILSLAIGVVNPDPTRVHSHHDVATLASDAKCQAKREGGPCLFVSRRRGGNFHEGTDDESNGRLITPTITRWAPAPTRSSAA